MSPVLAPPWLGKQLQPCIIVVQFCIGVLRAGNACSTHGLPRSRSQAALATSSLQQLPLLPALPTSVPAPAGVLCGAAASGAFTWTPENVAKSALCMLMSGPLLTGYTQVGPMA